MRVQDNQSPFLHPINSSQEKITKVEQNKLTELFKKAKEFKEQAESTLAKASNLVDRVIQKIRLWVNQGDSKGMTKTAQEINNKYFSLMLQADGEIATHDSSLTLETRLKTMITLINKFAELREEIRKNPETFEDFKSHFYTDCSSQKEKLTKITNKMIEMRSAMGALVAQHALEEAMKPRSTITKIHKFHTQ